MGPDVRPLARRLSASLLFNWAGLQITGALGSVVILHLTGTLRWVGIPYVVGNLSGAIGAYPAGRLMDRYGRVPVLVGGHLLAAAGAVIGVAGIVLYSVPGFLVGLALASVGNGATFLTRLAAADLYPAKERGRGLAIVVFSASIGAVVALPLLASAQRLAVVLAQPYYVVAWGFVPILSGIAATFVATVRPDPRSVAVEIHAADPPAVARGSDRPLIGLIVLAGLALVCAQGSMTAVMSVAGASLEHAGHSPNVIGITMTAHIVGMFFFSPWIGRLADRWGRRPVLISSGALLIAGTLSVALLPAGRFLALSLLVVGVGWSFAFIGSTAVIADATPPLRRGRVTGTIDVATAVFGSLGAVAGGWALAAGGLLWVGLTGAMLGGALLATATFTPVHRPTSVEG